MPCSLCKSVKGNKKTCPLNPHSKNISYKLHTNVLLYKKIPIDKTIPIEKKIVLGIR